MQYAITRYTAAIPINLNNPCVLKINKSQPLISSRMTQNTQNEEFLAAQGGEKQMTADPSYHHLTRSKDPWKWASQSVIQTLLNLVELREKSVNTIYPSRRQIVREISLINDSAGSKNVW